MNKTTVIVCDSDTDELFRIHQGLVSNDFELEIISDVTELVSIAQTRYPSIVIANPDIQGFNEYDVCKKLMKDKNIPVLLLMDRNSTHRATIDQCQAYDVLTKPVVIDNLMNLVHKHMAAVH